MKTKYFGMVLAWLATLFLLTACGGGGGGSTTPAATLSSIAITTASPSVALGLTSQFTATGTYSDKSTANITSKVTWASSATTVATINSSGLASSGPTSSGFTQGTTNITASLSGVTSNVAVLTVTAPVLTIAINPASSSLPFATTRSPFTATGTMSDGSTASWSTLTWASSNTAVATIVNTTGVVTTQLIVGSTNITASTSTSNGTVTSNAALLTVSGSFATTGPMTTTRSGHTATLLSSGMVLVTGGTGTTQLTEPAELFNPGTGTFAATTTSMTTVRNGGHTATWLPSISKVLITGGINGSGYLSSAELFDPSTGLFAATGSMGTVRAYHTATLLSNGQVLITGGFNVTGGGSNYLSSAELFDPTGIGSFAPITAPMKAARMNHTATLLPGGKVLIAGGVNGSGFPVAAELYDPTLNTFTTTGSMAQARQYHAATLLSDGTGRVLITGGDTGGNPFSSTELFNPAGNGGLGSFTITGGMTSARTHHTATLLSSGDVLVTGGYGSLAPATSPFTYLNSAELYGVTLGSFGATSSMATARGYHTATLLPSSGKVLVTGGTGSSGTTPTSLSSAELF